MNWGHRFLRFLIRTFESKNIHCQLQVDPVSHVVQTEPSALKLPSCLSYQKCCPPQSNVSSNPHKLNNANYPQSQTDHSPVSPMVCLEFYD